LAIAIVRGTHDKKPLEGQISILVPITGTEASRRAAEVAIATARASRARITALYIAGSPLDALGHKRLRGTRTRRHEEGILKDVAEMAEQYEVPLQTAVRMDLAPDDAILREASRRRHNLIVMGVSRRPGDRLYFGNVAGSVAVHAKQSILFVASGGASTAPEGRARKQAQDEAGAQAITDKEEDATA
jgi:nucleotide-binding universal stress UspA family protein